MLKRMLKRYSLALAVMLPVAAACSDENPTGPRAGALVGRWQITSLQVSGVELAEAGTSLEIMFTAAGTYAVITNDDGSGHCDATSCTETGTYEATSTHITMDPGVGRRDRIPLYNPGKHDDLYRKRRGDPGQDGPAAAMTYNGNTNICLPSVASLRLLGHAQWSRSATTQEVRHA